MTTSTPYTSSGHVKQKKSAHAWSNLFKVTKSATRTKKLGRGIKAVSQQRKASKTSRDAARAGELWSIASGSSWKTTGSVQEHGPRSDAECKKAMGRIYTDLHNESWNSSIAAGCFADVQRRAPELVVECLAKFGVVEAAVALMTVPNAPLSSEVIIHVASEFVGLSNRVKTERLSSFKELTCKRYGEFAACENLMSLSILSHSTTFREAAETWDDENWSILVGWIRRNVVSIAVFAKLRGLDFETSLKRVADHVPVHHEPSFHRLGNPRYNVCPGPTDLWVISEANGIKPPFFQGNHQLSIDHNIYQEQHFLYHERPQYWPQNIYYPSDPTLRHPGQGECACCDSPDICACDPNTHPAIADTLVELHDYGDYKGTGVRALQTIHKGAMLGEYVGELRHANFRDDPVYGFDVTTLDGQPHEVIATLSAKRRGNWTRFINHSCRPSCDFEQRAVGGRICIVVVAQRGIEWGEEVTVGYGDGYWSQRRRCRCGEDCCQSRVWEEREEKQKGEVSIDGRAEQFLEELGDSLGFGGVDAGDVGDGDGSENVEEDGSGDRVM